MFFNVAQNICERRKYRRKLHTYMVQPYKSHDTWILVIPSMNEPKLIKRALKSKFKSTCISCSIFEMWWGFIL